MICSEHTKHTHTHLNEVHAHTGAEGVVSQAMQLKTTGRPGWAEKAGALRQIQAAQG